MSNLNKHIKSDKIKWIATVIALLLVSAALIGMGLQIFGKGKQKPSEWFKKNETRVETSTDTDAIFDTTENDKISVIENR